MRPSLEDEEEGLSTFEFEDEGAEVGELGDWEDADVEDELDAEVNVAVTSEVPPDGDEEPVVVAPEAESLFSAPPPPVVSGFDVVVVGPPSVFSSLVASAVLSLARPPIQFSRDLTASGFSSFEVLVSPPGQKVTV